MLLKAAPLNAHGRSKAARFGLACVGARLDIKCARHIFTDERIDASLSRIRLLLDLAHGFGPSLTKCATGGLFLQVTSDKRKHSERNS